MAISVALAQKRDLKKIHNLLRNAKLSTNLTKCTYVLKAVSDYRIIGAIGVEFWGDFVSLRALTVDRNFRRQGVGKALVLQALQLAKLQSATGIYAYTLFWNMRFFSSCGFARVPKTSAPTEVAASAVYHYPHYRYCCLMEYQGG